MTATPHETPDTVPKEPSATALVRAAKAGLAGNQALNCELEGRVAELEAAWGGPAALSPQQRGRIRDICMAEFLQGCLEGWMAGRDYLVSGKEGHQQASMVIGEWRSLVTLKGRLVDSLGLGYAPKPVKSLEAFVAEVVAARTTPGEPEAAVAQGSAGEPHQDAAPAGPGPAGGDF
jgi:hypothetical protein